MTEITKDEQIRIMLNILDSIDAFCRKNNLRYYLHAGTLIGAIRHKGFIPWDDDVDIAMPREDYERFCSIYNESTDRYRIVTYKNTKGYYMPYGKVIDTRTILIHENVNSKIIDLGVFIDVFPLDNCSSDYKKAVKLYKKCKFLNSIKWTKVVKASDLHGWKKIAFPLAKMVFLPFSLKTILNKIDRIGQKYAGVDSRYIAVVTVMTYGLKELFDKKWFAESIQKEFENHKFSCPSGYDNILSKMYGNYMCPPPIEKQICPHSYYRAYWKGQS